jgi:hypothetical protein
MISVYFVPLKWWLVLVCDVIMKQEKPFKRLEKHITRLKKYVILNFTKESLGNSVKTFFYNARKRSGT